MLHCTSALSENSCCEDKFLDGGHQHLNIKFQQGQQRYRMAVPFNGGPYQSISTYVLHISKIERYVPMRGATFSNEQCCFPWYFS